MLPRSFRPAGALIALSTLAMALSLAAVTSTVCDWITAEIGIVSAPITFLFAIIWSLALRSEASYGGVPFRWSMTPILAALNAGYISAAMVFVDSTKTAIDVSALFAVGVTFGAIFWVPGLLFSSILYAVPIEFARQRAKLGLSEGQRAESLVAILCGGVGLLSLMLAIPLIGPRPEGRVALYLLCPLASAAALTGALSAALIWLGENRRRAFLKRVEAGTIEHMRLAVSGRRRVLLRTIETADDYRTVTLEEELVSIDDLGHTRWVLSAGERMDGGN